MKGTDKENKTLNTVGGGSKIIGGGAAKTTTGQK